MSSSLKTVTFPVPGRYALVITGPMNYDDLFNLKIKDNVSQMTKFLTDHGFDVRIVENKPTGIIEKIVYEITKDASTFGTNPNIFIYFTGTATYGSIGTGPQSPFLHVSDKRDNLFGSKSEYLDICLLYYWIKSAYITCVVDICCKKLKKSKMFIEGSAMIFGGLDIYTMFIGTTLVTNKSYTSTFIDIITEKLAQIPETLYDDKRIADEHSLKSVLSPAIPRLISCGFSDIDSDHWEQIMNNSEPAGYKFLRQFRV